MSHHTLLQDAACISDNLNKQYQRDAHDISCHAFTAFHLHSAEFRAGCLITRSAHAMHVFASPGLLDHLENSSWSHATVRFRKSWSRDCCCASTRGQGACSSNVQNAPNTFLTQNMSILVDQRRRPTESASGTRQEALPSRSKPFSSRLSLPQGKNALSALLRPRSFGDVILLRHFEEKRASEKRPWKRSSLSALRSCQEWKGAELLR